MASKVGSNGKIISFEPQPQYFSMIQNSIKLNAFNHITVDNRALWNKSGEILKFYLSENPNNSGTSSLVNHGLYLNEERVIDVETVTFFDYIKDIGLQKIKLVKIDVEKAEFQVLEGMKHLLEANLIDYIILETCAHGEPQKLLESRGYKCFYIDAVSKKIIQIEEVAKDHFGDFFFCSSKVDLDNFSALSALWSSSY